MRKVTQVGEVNPSEDNICRTLKAQYYKNNINNLLEVGAFGCSGVWAYFGDSDEKQRDNNRRIDAT